MLEHFLNIFQWKRETRLEFQPVFFFFFLIQIPVHLTNYTLLLILETAEDLLKLKTKLES